MTNNTSSFFKAMMLRLGRDGVGIGGCARGGRWGGGGGAGAAERGKSDKAENLWKV